MNIPKPNHHLIYNISSFVSFRYHLSIMQDIEYGQFCDLDPHNAIHVPMSTKRSIVKINVSSDCMQKTYNPSKKSKKSNTSLSSLQSHEMYVRSLPSTDFTKYMRFQDKDKDTVTVEAFSCTPF